MDGACHDSFSHESSISAISISNSRQIMASGDINTVRIWDAQACTEISTLTAEGCQVLSFSPDDMKLVSVGWDDTGKQQTICVWMTQNGQWNDAYLALRALAGHDRVHFATFDTNHSYLVTGGRQHVNFWSEKHNTLSISNKGALSEKCINDSFVCGISVENNNKLIAGTNSGTFVVWEEKKIVAEVKAHNGCVMSLCACPEGFISGCTKGIAILWSTSMQKIASFDVTTISTSPIICSLDTLSHPFKPLTTAILLRTQSDDILEISSVTGNISLLCRSGSEIIPSVAPFSNHDGLEKEEDVP